MWAGNGDAKLYRSLFYLNYNYSFLSIVILTGLPIVARMREVSSTSASWMSSVTRTTPRFMRRTEVVVCGMMPVKVLRG